MHHNQHIFIVSNKSSDKQAKMYRKAAWNLIKPRKPLSLGKRTSEMEVALKRNIYGLSFARVDVKNWLDKEIAQLLISPLRKCIISQTMLPCGIYFLS